jgi:hypothetical protein
MTRFPTILQSWRPFCCGFCTVWLSAKCSRLSWLPFLLSWGSSMRYPQCTNLWNLELNWESQQLTLFYHSSLIRVIFDTQPAKMSFCFHRLASEGNFAVLCSKYYTEYNEARKYMDSNGRSLICHLQEPFSLQFVTMVVQKGSFLLDNLAVLLAV